MGKRTFLWILAAYFVVRWLLGMMPGYVADTRAYKRWALGAGTVGIASVYDSTNIDYPPLYAYILYPIGVFYLAVTPQETPGEVPDSTLLTLLVKLPPFLFDLLLAYLLYLLVARRRLWGEERSGPRYGRIAALLYLWNPVVLWDSAYWGQPDGIHSALILASLMFLGRGLAAPSGIMLSAAGLMKPLAVPVLPLAAAGALARRSWKGLLLLGAGGVGAALLIFAPFLLTGRGGAVVRRVLGDADLMSLTSSNAHNLWWLIGPWKDSDAPFLGPVTAEQLGFALFAVAAIALLARAWPWLRRTPAGPGLEAGVLALGASITALFFFLSTHMHENHLFMAVPLVLALAGRSRRWAWIAVAISVATFSNVLLHDFDVTLMPPFTWGGASPVENGHIGRPFAWGELIGTYVSLVLVVISISWTLLETLKATGAAGARADGGPS